MKVPISVLPKRVRFTPTSRPKMHSEELHVDHTLAQMNFLADIGLTPSEARDVSMYPGFVDVDFQTMASWVLVKDKLGFSSYEVAKVLKVSTSGSNSERNAQKKSFSEVVFVFKSS